MIRILTAALLVALLGACATPALQVKVPTMTVADAWRAVGHQGAVTEVLGDATPGGASAERLDRPALARWRSASGATLAPVEGSDGGPPIPVVTAPDVRMAWVRPWQDAQGNRHFGHWIAMPVQGPRWVLPDGSYELIENGVSTLGSDSRRSTRGAP